MNDETDDDYLYYNDNYKYGISLMMIMMIVMVRMIRENDDYEEEEII